MEIENCLKFMSQNTNQQSNNNFAVRPPIVVVMGHVDHGKTKLLDYIRNTKVVDKESGGITQHIGAYEVEVKDKEGRQRKITFIDTPGHEAFSAMRSRGAKVADIAVLVVAADEGVKPQTLEALESVKKSGIPFVVALNKIDKENAEQEKVKKELLEHDVQIEEWGGKVPVVALSAKTGENVDSLLEMILLIADLEELRGDLDANASGVVVESHLDSKRGIVATLLLRNGVLRKGDFVRADNAVAKTRILEDYAGRPVAEVYPSSPARVVGFDRVPSVGSAFESFASASGISSAIPAKASREAAKPALAERDKSRIVVPLVIKADVAGSLEAIEHEIMKLFGNGAGVNILRFAAGDISEDDAKLASGSPDTIILGFRVKVEKAALPVMERFGVSFKLFDIIYEIGDWLKEEIEKRLPKEWEEKVMGQLKIIKIFKKEKKRQVVGGKVISGKMAIGKDARILRRGSVVAAGKILELRHLKDVVKEMSEGKECGALIESPFEIAVGDVIEATEKELVGTTLRN